MQTMAAGLAGHEHDFYQIVSENPWLGGDQEYSTLNEAFPYWYNGLVALAYGIDDGRLKQQVLNATDYVISHQQADGWLGPETDVHARNFWARYPFFLGLIQLLEAEPSVATTVVPAIHRFVDLMHSMLANNYQGYVAHANDTFDEQWGRSRAADMILSLQWLYEHYPMNNTQNIWENMVYLNNEAYDWAYWFDENVFIKVDLDTLPSSVTDPIFPYTHGVNAAQGLKALAVIRRFTHNETLLESVRRGVNWTFEYHGSPSGGIIGDERESGLSPSRGTELCTVVETMFSMSTLYQNLGDNDFADKTEQAAFNALPVMLMGDWWAHQYIAAVNQPYSEIANSTPYWNVGPYGEVFGLQPNYPCCAVNHPQGYPKFLPATFVRNGANGIAHALLSPATMAARTASGIPVNITCQTNYPFGSLLYYTVTTPSPFTFSVRVPSWSDPAFTTTSVNGGAAMTVSPDTHTGMHDIAISSGTTMLTYNLSMAIRVEPRANNSIAVHHGPLLYALPLNPSFSSVPVPYAGAPSQAQQWTITPSTPWNLAIDPSTLTFWPYDNRDNDPLPYPVWGDNKPPVSISALACEIAWDTVDQIVPAEVPWSGDGLGDSSVRNCTGRMHGVELKPYGSLRVHMAEFPYANLAGNGTNGTVMEREYKVNWWKTSEVKKATAEDRSGGGAQRILDGTSEAPTGR